MEPTALPVDLAAAQALMRTLAASNAVYSAVAAQLYQSIEASTEELRRQLAQRAARVGQLVNLIA
ncbi:hypothetical protein HS125_14800 [bacterium]|nr:hypothetical protein [bacterium]